MAKCWRQVSMAQAANGGVLLTELVAWLNANGIEQREHADWIDTIRAIEDNLHHAKHTSEREEEQE